MSLEHKVSRRAFLATGGAAGAALVLGFYIHHETGSQRSAAQGLQPNGWIRIAPDDNITVMVEIPEMGQGPRTVDTMMLADELEADASKIRVEQAPVVPSTYKNLVLPPTYKHLRTGGSGGTQGAWDYMRKVGAQAREMLIAAAAQQWQVPKQECGAENSTVVHKPSGRRVTYGALVATASKLPVPKAEDIPLKQPRDFKLIGKAMPRVDVPAKVSGSAMFGIDVRVPEMLFAVIERCPYFGGKLQSFDASATKAVPGVREVFAVPPIRFLPNLSLNANVAGGVAIVADSTWAAMQGRKSLKVSWDKGPRDESTEGIRQKMLAGAMAEPTVVWVNQGNALQALQKSRHRIEATYEMPFQAHATMEPMNTTVHVHRGGIEVWSPTQIGEFLQNEIAGLAGIPPEKVTVHMTHCGGSFGRRYQWDYAAEAWQVAKEVKRPVQLLWTREDDMQHDFYRPYSYHRLAGALGDAGDIAAWSHRIVSTPIRPVFDAREKLTPERVASQEGGGADLMPYGATNFRVDFFPVESAVPRAWWRSVSDSFNGFAMECFVDELAHAARIDPYEFRLRLLREDRKVPQAPQNAGDPPLDTRRFREVLKLAAGKSGWGNRMPAGYGRGIACRYTFGSYIAHVAEVSADKNGNVRVHRIVVAVDPGIAVNPDGVKAMAEGGTNFALTQVLQGEITIKDTTVEQSNFDGYQVLRMNYAPDIEVHVAPSGTDVGGMGETAVPGTAPAVANAVFAATGKRLRRLPIDPAFLGGR